MQLFCYFAICGNSTSQHAWHPSGCLLVSKIHYDLTPGELQVPNDSEQHCSVTEKVTAWLTGHLAYGVFRFVILQICFIYFCILHAFPRASFCIIFSLFDKEKGRKGTICFVTHQPDFIGNSYLQIWSQNTDCSEKDMPITWSFKKWAYCSKMVLVSAHERNVKYSYDSMHKTHI